MQRLALSLCLALSFATAALAQARLVLERSNAAESDQQIAKAIEDAQREVLEQFNPTRTAQIREVVDLIRAEYAKYVPAVMDTVATVYARYFTAGELAQIAAFYATPVGLKMIREMPALLSESMNEAEAVGLKAAEEVMTKLRPELEKRNLKLGPGPN